jgi:hypothetical protein
MKLFNELKHSNKGASLVLVSAFCLIVLGIAATLTILASMLLSNAEHRNRQDQAYELATSLSARVEELILNPPSTPGTTQKTCIDLEHFINDCSGVIVSKSDFDGIPDSTVEAVVSKKTDAGGNTYYELTVTATAAGEIHIHTAEYTGTAVQGYSRK